VVSEEYHDEDLLLRNYDGIGTATDQAPWWVATATPPEVPIMTWDTVPAGNIRNTVFAMNYILEPGGTVRMVNFEYSVVDTTVGGSISGRLNEYVNSVVAANDYPGDSPDPSKSYKEEVLYILKNGYEMYTTGSSIQLPTETHFRYTAVIGEQRWELDWPEDMQLWSWNILIYDHAKYITFSWVIHTNDFDGHGYQGACLFVRHVNPDTKEATYSMVMRYHNVINEAATFTVQENGSKSTYAYWAYYAPDLKMVRNPKRPT
jgi:hypothetical protein